MLRKVKANAEVRSETKSKRGSEREAWEDGSCLLQSGEDEAVGGVWLGHLLCHLFPCLFFFFFLLVLSIGHRQLCPLQLWLPHLLLFLAFFKSLNFARLSQALDAEQLGCFNQGEQEVSWDSCLTCVHESQQVLHDPVSHVRYVHNRVGMAARAIGINGPSNEQLPKIRTASGENQTMR